MIWKVSERVLETPRGFAGEEGADFVGLNPGGAFHISFNIFESLDLQSRNAEMTKICGMKIEYSVGSRGIGRFKRERESRTESEEKYRI